VRVGKVMNNSKELAKFKNLVIIIDRSTEHYQKGFTVLVVLGIWDSDSGALKDIVHKKLKLKHGKKYGRVEKNSKKSKLKEAIMGRGQINLHQYIAFLKIYRTNVTGHIHKRDLPAGFFRDLEYWIKECKFVLGDKDIITILKRLYPNIRVIEEKESSTTFKQYKHLMLLADNIAYFARIAWNNHDYEFLKLLNINKIGKY